MFQALPHLDPLWRLALVTGFLGALTTFSSFSAEVVDLLMHQRYALALGTGHPPAGLAGPDRGRYWDGAHSAIYLIASGNQNYEGLLAIFINNAGTALSPGAGATTSFSLGWQRSPLILRKVRAYNLGIAIP